MASDREKLLASRQSALAAKDDFVQRYVSGRRDRAAGIGVNSSGDGWAVKVFVENGAAAVDMPKDFHGHAVEVEVTGPVHALHD